MTTPDFGDRVRIKDNEATRGLELSGREGQVFGYTTPSITGVSVIGSPTEDYAINVHFEEIEANTGLPLISLNLSTTALARLSLLRDKTANGSGCRVASGSSGLGPN